MKLQQRAIDDNGDRLGDWDEGFSRFARVVPRTRGETVLQQRIQGIQLIEVTLLRDLATAVVDTGWRLIWADVNYNIQSVAPSEDRRELNILAQADQSDG